MKKLLFLSFILININLFSQNDAKSNLQKAFYIYTGIDNSFYNIKIDYLNYTEKKGFFDIEKLNLEIVNKIVNKADDYINKNDSIDYPYYYNLCKAMHYVFVDSLQKAKKYYNQTVKEKDSLLLENKNSYTINKYTNFLTDGKVIISKEPSQTFKDVVVRFNDSYFTKINNWDRDFSYFNKYKPRNYDVLEYNFGYNYYGNKKERGDKKNGSKDYCYYLKNINKIENGLVKPPFYKEPIHQRINSISEANDVYKFAYYFNEHMKYTLKSFNDKSNKKKSCEYFIKAKHEKEKLFDAKYRPILNSYKDVIFKTLINQRFEYVKKDKQLYVLFDTLIKQGQKVYDIYNCKEIDNDVILDTIKSIEINNKLIRCDKKDLKERANQEWLFKKNDERILFKVSDTTTFNDILKVYIINTKINSVDNAIKKAIFSRLLRKNMDIVLYNYDNKNKKSYKKRSEQLKKFSYNDNILKKTGSNYIVLYNLYGLELEYSKSSIGLFETDIISNQPVTKRVKFPIKSKKKIIDGIKYNNASKKIRITLKSDIKGNNKYIYIKKGALLVDYSNFNYQNMVVVNIDTTTNNNKKIKIKIDYDKQNNEIKGWYIFSKKRKQIIYDVDCLCDDYRKELYRWTIKHNFNFIPINDVNNYTIKEQGKLWADKQKNTSELVNNSGTINFCRNAKNRKDIIRKYIKYLEKINKPELDTANISVKFNSVEITALTEIYVIDNKVKDINENLMNVYSFNNHPTTFEKEKGIWCLTIIKGLINTNYGKKRK